MFIGAPLFAAGTTTQVTVIDKSDDSLASIWIDATGTTPKSNPFFITSSGQINFYADPGTYDITAENGGFSRTWPDVAIVDPDASGGGGGGTVDAVVAGEGVLVDDTDPANPIVSSDFAVDSATASYTLSATNNGQWMDLSGSGTIDITCPPESSVDLGAKFVHIISNYGSGTVTIVAGSGVTVRPPPGGTLVVPQYATVGIKKADFAADTYIVFGPTEAS